VLKCKHKNIKRVDFELKGGVLMATSSITKSFVISGKEQVEKFADAIEKSAQNRPVRIPVSATHIETEEELREFMKFREMKAKEKSNADG
jgi:hypothetical protein